MRFIFISFVALALIYLFLRGRTMERSSDKPIFLQIDEIALVHETKIDINIESNFIPDSLQIQTLKKDYSNIWAHLNHLYSTNDIISGKEYYTENWFRQLASHYNDIVEPIIFRQDEYHNLYIKNWASDGLVCTAIDSNVLLTYTYPNQKKKTCKTNLAIVLLYQGDNWRIDALKILDESCK